MRNRANVQTHDVYDYDWDYTHPKFERWGYNAPRASSFDGFIHIGNRAYDPRTHEEIDFDDYDVQTDEQRFGGEPISLAMAKVDL